MVFAPIRKYVFGKELVRAGIPKDSPSHQLAMDFALRIPEKVIEGNIYHLKYLSHQNEGEFEAELSSLEDVFNSTGEIRFGTLEKLRNIFGNGSNGGNALRAISGMQVEDNYGREIYGARNRIGGQRIDEFKVPEAALSVSKSPDEFLSNYVFSLLIFTELGFQHPGPCYEHVADLTRRHPDAAQYRKKLEDIMTEYAKEFHELTEVDRFVGVKPNVILYGFPSVAFLAERDKKREAITAIRDFTTELRAESSYAPNHLLQEILGPITVCSNTVDEMQECLNTVLETTRDIRQAGVKLFPSYFSFLRDFEGFAGSVDDFRQAMAAAQSFFIRLGTGSKLPQLEYMLGTFTNSVSFRDVREFTETMDKITEDVLQFPYDSRGGYPYPPADGIGKLSSTPAELIRNNRLYGRLVNSLESAPYLDLVKAVNEQSDTTEDECVGALTRFYGKIKDTSEYQFSDYLGDFGPGKIWEQFFRANLLPNLLRVNRAGDFDVQLSLSTHTDSGYDDYMGDWTATYIDSVHLDISPRK